jgi:hypothetical protein
MNNIHGFIQWFLQQKNPKSMRKRGTKVGQNQSNVRTSRQTKT